MAKPDYTDAINRATEKLRQKSLPKRTSTYIEGSIRQTNGSYAEVDAQSWLLEKLSSQNWHVIMWQEAKAALGFESIITDGERDAIENSKNGDLYVYNGSRLLFSVEVKSSEKHPNVSITWGELVDSSARYLLAVTPAGKWICTMEDARKHAIEREKHTGGSYYLIPHDKITKLDIKELIDGEKRQRHRNSEAASGT